jgi:uncharacterized protein YlbG (UPF0298 family)
MTTPEHKLEAQLIEKLRELKYEYRADICDRATLEKNFREKFELEKPPREGTGPHGRPSSTAHETRGRA